ncbi:MAG: hypothetical protein COS89_07110 [Deltaproteobacteria bacterium CG07_land_8_20_14_0_80_38_7]|nr:MAG: hypothetical protein COS89_07110 [Deltaproteobacteria bacterium CG07_land_8_20_14_0_80_38_7]
MNLKIILPAIISDGRLDTILGLLSAVRDDSFKTHLILDWSNVKEISPAGFAILACVFDSLVEQGCTVTSKKIKKELKEIPVIKNFIHINEFKNLPPPNIHSFENNKIILRGNTTLVDIFFQEYVKNKFSFILSDDLIYSVNLISNELMQNSVDHSTSERYYIYAGLWKNEFHVGVLDMGVTIPAKLKQKYKCENDLEYLELSLQEGIGTRRQRPGGLGLSYFFDYLKEHKGRLTILSRGAQIRKYFNTRRSQKNLLKYPLYGTWCFSRFNLLVRRSA